MKAKILIELKDNHITKVWAKADDQTSTRIVITPKESKDLIELITKICIKGKEIITPRRQVIEKLNDQDDPTKFLP